MPALVSQSPICVAAAVILALVGYDGVGGKSHDRRGHVPHLVSIEVVRDRRRQLIPRGRCGLVVVYCHGPTMWPPSGGESSPAIGHASGCHPTQESATTDKCLTSLQDSQRHTAETRPQGLRGEHPRDFAVSGGTDEPPALARQPSLIPWFCGGLDLPGPGGPKGMLSEDRAETRRLQRAEGSPIKAIARVLKISKNTVKEAWSQWGPPKYQRPLEVRSLMRWSTDL